MSEEINKIIDNLEGCIGMFDYLITPIESNLLVAYIKELQQENQELKKQLEELKSTNKVLSEELTKDKILKQDCLTTCYGIPIGDIPKLINQQKEFIEYLEKEKERCLTFYSSTPCMYAYDVFKDVLSKYKEIIGGKDV